MVQNACDNKVGKPVKDIQIKKDITVTELIQQFGQAGGFTAKKVAIAIEIFREMLQKEVTVFLSFPAAMISTGTRGVIRELVKRKMIDVMITTCGTLDHDLARLWRNYYHGSFMLDDVKLHQEGVNRIGNILAPNESYGLILEEKLQPMMEEIYDEKKSLSTREFVWEIGKRLENESNREESIIYWCYRNKIPVFIPAVTDGAVGFQMWLFYQQHRDFQIDIMRDESELSDIVYKAERTGAVIIGGGVSKHHTIWWNQFRDGLDYAVYITTAVEWDGSLSGARVREAVSWGKVKEDARHVTVEGDATLILPLIVSALI
jgi:deoxyhypusine synthase